jgi:hypothetical protein
MAGLVPAIHAFFDAKTWMPGTRPGMTRIQRTPRLDDEIYFAFGCNPNRLAISRSCIRFGRSPINRREAWPGVIV